MAEFRAIMDIKRAVEDEEGRWIVEGFATVADVDEEDRFISEEALKDAEKDLLTYSTVLHNHNRSEEIGKVLKSEYRPEEKALWVKVLISKTVPEIWQKIKEGVLNKFSIHGKAREWEWRFDEERQKNILYIKKIDLFETSLVSVPSHPGSRTLAWYVERGLREKGGVKMIPKMENGQPTTDEYAKVLVDIFREVTLSDQTVKDLIAILDKLLATDITDEQRTMLRKIKAVLSQQAGGTYPYPGPTAYPGALTRGEQVMEELKKLREMVEELSKQNHTAEVKKDVQELKKTVGTLAEESTDEKVLERMAEEIQEIKRMLQKLPVRLGSEGRPVVRSITDTEEYRNAPPNEKLRMLLGVK